MVKILRNKDRETERERERGRGKKSEKEKEDENLPSYFFEEKERRGVQTSASDVWTGWSFRCNLIFLATF
jgi:hypothetical protein